MRLPNDGWDAEMAHWEKCEAVDLQIGDTINGYGKLLSVPDMDEDEKVRLVFEGENDTRLIRTFYAYRELEFLVEDD